MTTQAISMTGIARVFGPCKHAGRIGGRFFRGWTAFPPYGTFFADIWGNDCISPHA